MNIHQKYEHSGLQEAHGNYNPIYLRFSNTGIEMMCFSTDLLMH